MERKVQYSEGVACRRSTRGPRRRQTRGKAGGGDLCHGFTAVKEMWLPITPRRLRAEDTSPSTSITATSARAVEPRSRLIPQAQVTDIRSAMTFMQNPAGGEPDCTWALRDSFGCANVVVHAGVDERAKCTVAVVGPGDCERQFRFGPQF